VLLLQLLYDTIKLCLSKATSARLSSIAFPTLGCGRLGYDPCDVADCFLRAQRDTAGQLQVGVNEKRPDTQTFAQSSAAICRQPISTKYSLCLHTSLQHNTFFIFIFHKLL